MPLERVDELAPLALVVVYTIMPNGVIVADSLDFPVDFLPQEQGMLVSTACVVLSHSCMVPTKVQSDQ